VGIGVWHQEQAITLHDQQGRMGRRVTYEVWQDCYSRRFPPSTHAHQQWPRAQAGRFTSYLCPSHTLPVASIPDFAMAPLSARTSQAGIRVSGTQLSLPEGHRNGMHLKPWTILDQESALLLHHFLDSRHLSGRPPSSVGGMVAGMTLPIIRRGRILADDLAFRLEGPFPVSLLHFSPCRGFVAYTSWLTVRARWQKKKKHFLHQPDGREGAGRQILIG
jgi:hypothetical protein